MVSFFPFLPLPSPAPLLSFETGSLGIRGWLGTHFVSQPGLELTEIRGLPPKD